MWPYRRGASRREEVGQHGGSDAPETWGEVLVRFVARIAIALLRDEYALEWLSLKKRAAMRPTAAREDAILLASSALIE